MGPLLVYAAPLSCSVSDSEGKLVVREIATRPLTQDLLNHEVRGPGGPQPQLRAPGPHPLLKQLCSHAHKQEQHQGPSRCGRGDFCAGSSPAQVHHTIRLSLGVFLPTSRTVTSWTRGV